METPSWNSPPPTFILLKWRKSNIESPKWHQISKPYISTFRSYGSYGFLGYIGIYLFREKFWWKGDVCHRNPTISQPHLELRCHWCTQNDHRQTQWYLRVLFNDPIKESTKISIVKKRRNTHTHPVVVDVLPYIYICWSVFVCWISDCVSFFGNETRLLYMAKAEGKDESVEETCR